MKNKIFLYSLTSLAVTAAGAAYANGQTAYAPALEGGITASVGTFYVTPTSDYQDFSTLTSPNGSQPFVVENVNPGYQFGIDASLGYVFEETANSVELFFRNISTSDTGSASGLVFFDDPVDTYGDLGYELDSFDLMFSQFLDVGQVMQVRLMGGLAYLDLNRSETATGFNTEDVDSSAIYQSQSKFRGWGPRVGIDTRYGFDDAIEGLGIVGGGSMAYLQGDLDSNSNSSFDEEEPIYVENNPGNHAVLNFRANLGLDYVYFFDNNEKSTLGLEIGYLIDFYDDAALVTETGNIQPETGGYITPSETTSVSFAGPYVNLKAAF